MSSHNQASGDHSHHHPPHLEHHYDTPAQQFESGKMGMWIFLVTEILLFGGLFCAYAVYRANHPEIFIYAHKYLDVPLGALNTVVLIFSSLTMAMAVRSAQLSQQKALVILLSITLLCGFIFLGVKAVEYNHKWKHGLKWGKLYDPDLHSLDGHETEQSHDVANAKVEQSLTQSGEGIDHEQSENEEKQEPQQGEMSSATGTIEKATAEKSLIEPSAVGPKGLASEYDEEFYSRVQDVPENVHLFFGIYFVMTGLHALHVIVGMGTIGWILRRSIQGHFSSEYFTPVDLTGLYWHLVDLIWIYLFPLLYLIH